MMLQQLKGRLVPIRLRQRMDRALSWATCGMLVGCIVGCAALCASWMGVELGATRPWLLLPLMGAGSALAGFAWPVSWESSARLVDRAYDLKDRTLTALDFAHRTNEEPIQELQMQDAMQRLTDVDAQRVLPWSVPRLIPALVIAFVCMLLLALLPTQSTTANARAGSLEVVQDQATLLEETLIEELEELAKETQDPELEELVDEMQKAVEGLRQPNVDQREALAQLSLMQASLAAAMKQLDVQRVDAQLQQLAEALQVADATRAASQSLQASKYDRAAKELEKIDASTMSSKQREATKANLQKLSKQLGEGQKGQLSEAVKEMIEGFESEDASKCKNGFCKAAGLCRKQGLRKKISECLGCQLNRLAECKGRCQGNCSNPGSNVAKSDQPNDKWGLGESNKPLGEEKTQLDSQRRNENLAGIKGEGPSQRQTLTSAEASQDATRSYQQRYSEYRKQMEEVLDSEPLPLGHRETVRKYFESIRPSNTESELISPATE